MRATALHWAARFDIWARTFAAEPRPQPSMGKEAHNARVREIDKLTADWGALFEEYSQWQVEASATVARGVDALDKLEALFEEAIAQGNASEDAATVRAWADKAKQIDAVAKDLASHVRPALDALKLADTAGKEANEEGRRLVNAAQGGTNWGGVVLLAALLIGGGLALSGLRKR